MREALLKIAAMCMDDEDKGEKESEASEAKEHKCSSPSCTKSKPCAKCKARKGVTKTSSAELGGGLGALVAGAPGAAVGGAIGAKEHHRGRAAVSSGLGSLGGGLAGALTLGGLAALLTHRSPRLRTHYMPSFGRRHGYLYNTWDRGGPDAAAAAMAALLGGSVGSVAGGALGGRYSDKKHGRK